MSLEIVIGNLHSHITGRIPDFAKIALSQRLTYKLKDAIYISKNINVRRRIQAKKLGIPYRPVDEWDGTVELFWPHRGQTFYTGMLGVVCEVLSEAKLKYHFNDKRVRPVQNMPHLRFDAKDKEEREYQNATIDISLKATRGIIQAGTGAGKTFCVAGLIGKIKTGPFLFFVLTRDLLEQAHEVLSKHLNVPIGRIGGGYFDIQDITVMTIQTAIRVLNRNNPRFKVNDYRYDEDDVWDEDDIDIKTKGDDIERLIKSTKGVYLDECHCAGARTVKETLFATKEAYWRYGGSATSWRDDGQEMMIQALFGKHLVEITPSWLISNNYLVRPVIFNVHIKDKKGDYHSYPKIYKECIVHNEQLNKLVAELIGFFEERGITSLCLVQQYDQAYNIQKSNPELMFIYGKQNKGGRTDAIQDLRDGNLHSAIATTLADEGLDVPRLGAGIIAGGGKSTTRVYQRIGRVLRPFPGKERAIVILFHHDGRYLQNHGKKVINILKREKEFVIRDSTPETIMDDLRSLLDKETLFAT